MERLMNQAQHAAKSILKYFGKHLDDFRREMNYSREIVLSDIMSSASIPDSMIKHTDSFKQD